MTRLVNAYHIWIGYPLSGARFNKLTGVSWGLYFFFILILRLSDNLWLFGVLAVIYFMIFLGALRSSFQKRDSMAYQLAISRDEKVKNGFFAGLGAMTLLEIFLFFILLVMSISSSAALSAIMGSEHYHFHSAFYLAGALWCYLIYILMFPLCVIKSEGKALLCAVPGIAVGITGLVAFPSVVQKVSEQISKKTMSNGSIQMVELLIYELPGGWFTVTVLAVMTVLVAGIVLKLSCRLYEEGR